MNTFSNLTNDELVFLDGWEEVYKKGILTFWVLFYISQEEYDASSLYKRLAKNDTSINEHSLYRLLRRLDDVGVIELSRKDGRNRYFTISQKGAHILEAFTMRNIAPLPTSINYKENI